MSSSVESLNVAIIGAGLAGALAARVLRETHNVTVFERAANATEVGAAINIGPNGVRILDTLSFDRSLAGSMPVGATKVYDHKGQLVLEKYPKYFDEYGADWLFHHRSNLRDEFVRLATVESKELGIGGRPAVVRWACGITDVDAETGKITLTTGEEEQYDLVIAADGIKSVVRPIVVGDSAFSTARPSGLSAFRFTLKASEIRNAFGELPEILQRDKPVCLTMLFSTDGSRRGMVLYPCRHFELLNFVCIVPDSALKTDTTESWSAVGDPAEMISILEDFPDWAVRYMKLTESVKVWQLRDQDPLPTYIRGRTVLIGQGGTQAVEDAEGFRLFLKPGISRDDVPAILKDYDSVRRLRASQIQNNTRQSQEKRTPEDVYRFEKYNWTYPGIVEGLARLKEGAELIQF